MNPDAAGAIVPLHEPLMRRRSTRAFDPRPLDDATLASLFEAARWAPSASNDQPWRHVIARRGAGAGFERLLATLTGSNPTWAHAAGALVVTAARRVRGPHDTPNAWAWHDAGIAWAMLAIQATTLGLATHPLGGFDADAVRAAIDLPAEYDPVTVTALGWPGDPEALEEPLRTRERAPRVRRPLAESVFEERFGAPAAFLAGPVAPAV
jgi:nitroreductase